MKFTKVTDTYKLANGVEIPCVGFGTWRVPGGEAAFKAVSAALKAGYRHVDTAAMYENEDGVGEAINKSGIKREEIFLTSKLNNSFHGYEETKAAFKKTLSDLNTPYVDLYLIHWPAPMCVRDRWKEVNAGSWKAMEEFYKEGKIRALGLSNFWPHHIEALLETANVAPVVNQLCLSPGATQPYACKVTRDLGMQLEAYSPLGKALIFNDETIKAVAKKHNATEAQVCIAWSLKMGFLPLPKSVTPERIVSNMDVFNINLDDADMENLANIDRAPGVVKNPDTAPN